MSDDEKKSYIRIIIEFIIKFPFKNPKLFSLFLLLLFGLILILIGLHSYHKTCSDYQCPDGYADKDNSDNIYCKGIVCNETDDKNTCCNEKQKCNEYSCPSGYADKDNSDNIYCKGIVCNETDDKNTCCNEKQKCNEYRCPSGYADKDNSDNIYCKDSVCNETDDKNTCCNESIDCEGNWSDFSGCSVECGGGTQTRTYNITTQPQYGGSPCPTSPEPQACNTDACVVDDTAEGGDPDVCTTPDTTGYSVVENSLERNNLSVRVSCEDGYGPQNVGASSRATMCPSHNTPYFLYGCEDKTGFCSGNTNSGNDFTCTSGYSDKSGKNTIIGSDLVACCDQQSSETQGTELPTCRDVVMIPNKIPSSYNTAHSNNYESCSEICNTMGDNCQSFAYGVVREGDRANVNRRNCLLGITSDIVDPSVINGEFFFSSWSFYPKCIP